MKILQLAKSIKLLRKICAMPDSSVVVKRLQYSLTHWTRTLALEVDLFKFINNVGRKWCFIMLF